MIQICDHFNLSVTLIHVPDVVLVSLPVRQKQLPVVGKEEVRMSRDMYWLRIDRYYSTNVPAEMDKNKTERSQEEAVFGLDVPESYRTLSIRTAVFLNHRG